MTARDGKAPQAHGDGGGVREFMGNLHRLNGIAQLFSDNPCPILSRFRQDTNDLFAAVSVRRTIFFRLIVIVGMSRLEFFNRQVRPQTIEYHGGTDQRHNYHNWHMVA